VKPLHKLLCVLLLLPFFSAAQSNYRAGYVVTSKGDTVKGFIDYQAWDSNPTSISFKSALADQEKKTFSMGGMRSFSVTGIAAYKKFLCVISMDITDERHVIEGRDTSFRIDTVFLKVLQQGKNVTLYSYTDNMKTRYYVGEAPDYKPTELTYRLYIDREATNVAGNTVNENTYQKQLFALANKYNAMDDKMTQTLEDPYLYYREGDLLKIVSRINNISKAEFEQKYNGHSKISLYAGIGVNISSISSDSQSSYSLGGGTGHTSSLPSFDLGIDLVPDPNGGRVELRAEVSVNPTTMDAKYKLNVAPYSAAEASFNQLGIYFTPQVMYNFYNAPNFKFYLGFGYSLTYSSFSNPYFQAQNKADQNAGFPQESFNFQKSNTAFLFKAGFRIYRNLEIYADYYTSQSSSLAGYFALDTQNTVIGVNYFFGL